MDRRKHRRIRVFDAHAARSRRSAVVAGTATSPRTHRTETADGTKFSITVKGRELYISLLAKSKAIEEELLEGFSASEVSDVRSFLQRFIKKTDPGIPDFWLTGNDEPA